MTQTTNRTVTGVSAPLGIASIRSRGQDWSGAMFQALRQAGLDWRQASRDQIKRMLVCVRRGGC